MSYQCSICNEDIFITKTSEYDIAGLANHLYQKHSSFFSNHAGNFKKIQTDFRCTSCKESFHIYFQSGVWSNVIFDDIRKLLVRHSSWCLDS